MSALTALDQLLHFLHHAPALFAPSGNPLLLRLHLPLPHHNEPVACVYHEQRFLVSGTDILRVLLFRFRCLARPISSMKKFEEGVFSDLRNLKPDEGARLEPARSVLLDSLYRFGCVRTQKRQKVFFWDVVDHDRLFRDAWEREARRERDAVEAFQRDHPGASLADPGAPLAELDDATVETAAVWHQTRPLLLTYVRSSQDPIERPLNADSVSAAMGGEKASASMLGLQRFRSSSNGSGRDEDRCGGLIARRRAAVARSRASSNNSDKSNGGVKNESDANLLDFPAMDAWWVTAGMADPNVWSNVMGPVVSSNDPFMNMTSMDLPALAGSTTTSAMFDAPMWQQPHPSGLLPSLPAWLAQVEPPIPSSQQALADMDPTTVYPELFAESYSSSSALPTLVNPTPDPTNGVRTSPDPPVLRGVVDRAVLMAELEAFLTPPSDAVGVGLQRLATSTEPSAANSVDEPQHALVSTLEPRARRISSPKVHVEEVEPESFPDLPPSLGNSRSSSPACSKTPWPIPRSSVANLADAVEQAVGHVSPLLPFMATPPSNEALKTISIGQRSKRNRQTSITSADPKRPRMDYV